MECITSMLLPSPASLDGASSEHTVPSSAKKPPRLEARVDSVSSRRSWASSASTASEIASPRSCICGLLSSFRRSAGGSAGSSWCCTGAGAASLVSSSTAWSHRGASSVMAGAASGASALLRCLACLVLGSVAFLPFFAFGCRGNRAAPAARYALSNTLAVTLSGGVSTRAGGGTQATLALCAASAPETCGCSCLLFATTAFSLTTFGAGHSLSGPALASVESEWHSSDRELCAEALVFTGIGGAAATTFGISSSVFWVVGVESWAAWVIMVSLRARSAAKRSASSAACFASRARCSAAAAKCRSWPRRRRSARLVRREPSGRVRWVLGIAVFMFGSCRTPVSMLVY
mmetsp:Transcript_10633/g.25260  ORF Transcript_10633/g.25260 Transcript_10633/m.25260 type:complete len:347 (-) Transcript_10633:588-1628(-)